MRTELKKMNLSADITPEYVFGIDLGTTNSAIAVRTTTSVPVLAHLTDTSKTMPSCVMWKDGKFIVGEEAYNHRYLPNTIYSVKRIMGTNDVITLIDGSDEIILTPAEVSAEILKELCRRVEPTYGEIKDAVITVPAYFNQRQIEDTLKASELAGLNVLHILKEPTSAGYVYSTISEESKGGEYIVYDLGGGTFDVTHLLLVPKTEKTQEVARNLENEFGIKLNSFDKSSKDKFYSRVLNVYGNSSLGGDDIDDIVANEALKRLSLSKLTVPREDFERLKLAAEQFKKIDAEGSENTINGTKYDITRDMLIKGTKQVYDETMRIMKPLFNTVDKDKIKAIILVGGSTKSPLIREWLKRDFPASEIISSLNPDETVAQGAAAVGYDLKGSKVYKFQDVLPLAIGVLINESKISVCIPTNTSIPHSTTKVFTTLYDNQESIEVKIYQGVSVNPDECIPLAVARINDLPPAPAGGIEVFVKFTINVSGRLIVTAESCGVEKQIVIDNIFSVNSTVKEIDQFKDTFYPLVESSSNKDKLIELFAKRDAVTSDNEKITCEEEIISLL